MHIHARGFLEKSIHGGEIEILAETLIGGAAEDYLGDVFLPYEFRDCIRDVAAFETHHFGAEIFGKVEIRFEGFYARPQTTFLPVST